MEFLYFLGRFHPLVLHLPIGFLVLAFALELASRRPSFEGLRPAVPFALMLSAVGATLTALLGYFLSLEGGYEGSSLTIHKWAGITLAVLTIGLYFLYRSETAKRFYFPAFVTTMLVLVATGHYGGNLTHGSTYLTEYAPRPVKKVLGIPIQQDYSDIDLATLDSLSAYVAIVNPILQDKCTSCHNPDKMKGELRLDTPAGIDAGGENGKILTAGNPDVSELIHRIHLPEEEEEHMPPDGKKQLTKDEIAFLEWWIAQGASYERPVADYEKPEAIQAAIKKRFDPEQPSGVYALDIEPLSDNKLLALREAGLPVRPLARGSALLEANLANDTTIKAEQLQRLSQASRQLVRLNLSNTPLTDDMLEVVTKLPHLMYLHLNQTNITDAGLAHLQGLEYLEYLNLYQTDVSDAGLASLSKLKNLKKLYLWQTKVTEQGVREMQAALPEAQINTGMERDTTLGALPWQSDTTATETELADQ